MKKWIAVLVMMICAGVGFAQEPNELIIDGWRTSIMSETNGASSFDFRLSYRRGILEPFAGIELPISEKPNSCDFGCKINSNDIVEAESIPWLSETLIDVFNEDLVLTAYTGFHTKIIFDDDYYVDVDGEKKSTFFGSIFGLEAKDRPESFLSIITEYQKNDNIGDCIYLGMMYRY